MKSTRDVSSSASCTCQGNSSSSSSVLSAQSLHPGSSLQMDLGRAPGQDGAAQSRLGAALQGSLSWFLPGRSQCWLLLFLAAGQGERGEEPCPELSCTLTHPPEETGRDVQRGMSLTAERPDNAFKRTDSRNHLWALLTTVPPILGHK